MILAQARDEMNQVNWVLDQFESTPRRIRNRARRRELLQMAVLASSRGIQVLIEEQFTRDLGFSDDDIYRSVETMRQDRALLSAFVVAECRLLRDLGVSAAAVEKAKTSLENVLLTLESKPDPEVTVERLQALLGTLERDLSNLQDQTHDDELKQRLIGILETLGGGLIVGANAAIGIGTTPVTFGLSAVGAAISTAAGTEMVSRGSCLALG
jgi:hypothetical protein